MFLVAAPWLGRCVLLFLVLAVLLGGGCSPDAFLVADEDRERNFQRAREAERLGDYEGAAEFYERAIEKNPRSASVHLGYASLCEGRLRRHADAVYHYQRYLKLRSGDAKDPRAVDIRRRITNCTEQLATSVPLVIRSETIARDLSAVRKENASLRGQVTNLTAGVANWSNEWLRVSLLLQQALAAKAVSGGGDSGAGTPTVGGGRTAGGAGRVSGGTVNRSSTPRGGTSGERFRLDRASLPGARAGTAVRTHRVQAGETMERIARRYGTTALAIQRANPQVRPRSMHVGTILRIPER